MIAFIITLALTLYVWDDLEYTDPRISLVCPGRSKGVSRLGTTEACPSWSSFPAFVSSGRR